MCSLVCGVELQKGDLSFKAGTIISITNQINSHWIEGKVGEDIGLFPRNYVKID